MSYNKKIDIENLSANICMEKVNNINEDFFKKNGRRKIATIHTYGCQMNAHDSEKLQGMLVEMGYEYIPDSNDTADIIVYNTCCIRENAENRVYGNLGSLKKKKLENPELKIVVCGCMMQQDAVIQTIKKSYRNVDVIFGTFNMTSFPRLLLTSMTTNQMIIDIWENHEQHTDYEEHKNLEDLPTIREKEFRSSVNIMYGCNNFCSYCIVPYVRGRERSRTIDDIMNEINNLAKSGVVEVVLLGQNVNSYGNDLGDTASFPMLLREINKVDGIKRIRFLTSHPKDLSEELIDAMATCDKVCKHIHLPIQSGSTDILAKMNRKYTKENYLNLVKSITDKIPDIAMTTDIIVGFPGETEEDFLETIDLYEQIKFSGSFTFIYSKRTGTPAANMDNQVPEDVVKNRFDRLLAVTKENSYNFHKSHVGKTLKVLVDSVKTDGDTDSLQGRAENNALVHFKGDTKNIGKILDVEIVGNKSFYLIGELK